MRLKQLNRQFKIFYKNKRYPDIRYPFELLKLNHCERIEVDFGDVIKCLEKKKETWLIYVDERGEIREILKNFVDEELACDYFYKWVTENRNE